jgi:SAM-dependent methyltransferase
MIAGASRSAMCPACGPAPSRIWLEHGASCRYERCLKCATVFTTAPSTRRHVAVAPLSSTVAAADLEWAEGRRTALTQAAAVLGRHASGGHILDVGCGAGTFFDCLDPARWTRCGVEVSAAAATHTARAHGADVFAGTLREAHLEAESLDAVSMLDVIYYFDDVRADLREAWRLLRPGGHLLIEIAGQRYQLLRSRGPVCALLSGQWTRLRPDDHRHWMSPKALRAVVADAGFDEIERVIVPSPTQAAHVRQLVTSAHRAVLSATMRCLPSVITLAPKYLVVARKPTASCR